MSKEALDKFGSFLVKKVRDQTIIHWEKIFNGQMNDQRSKEIRDMLSRFSAEEQSVFFSLLPEIVDSQLHYLMQSIEDEDDIEISVNVNGDHVNSLRDVSDGLAGELYSNEGWIARFSNISS